MSSSTICCNAEYLPITERTPASKLERAAHLLTVAAIMVIGALVISGHLSPLAAGGALIGCAGIRMLLQFRTAYPANRLQALIVSVMHIAITVTVASLAITGQISPIALGSLSIVMGGAALFICSQTGFQPVRKKMC